jgi:hypothetical protein
MVASRNAFIIRQTEPEIWWPPARVAPQVAAPV